jgi:MFS family permease
MAASNALSQAAGYRRPPYYGWYVLGASAFTEMLAIGSTSYAAGLFVLPLQRELLLSRAAAGSAIPILFTGAAIMATLVGYLLDRFPVQWVMTLGAISFGIGLVIISVTSSTLVMTLSLLLPVAFGFMAVGPLTTTTLVSRWFYRRRGRAFGIATVASSGGGIVVIPLLSWAIETFGWRSAIMMEALLISSIICVLAMCVIRSGPADLDLGDHPENAGRLLFDMPQQTGRAKERTDTPRWRLRDALATVNFWAVAIALAAITAIAQAIVVMIVPYSTELGQSPAAAALLITAFSTAAAIVKIGSGVLGEFINQRFIMLAATLAMIASLAIFLTSSNYPMLLLGCCLAGTALGCILPSTAALIASFFGSPSFGTVMGAIYVAIGVSSIISVRFVGTVFDRTGNYRIAFLAFMGLSIAAALGTMLLRARRSTPDAITRQAN